MLTWNRSQARIPLGLCLQELAPRRTRPPRCRIEARALEDVAHRAWRHTDTSPGEFAADPLIAPRRVLAGQAQDRSTNVLPGGWAAWTFPGVGPLAGNQVAVPAQQRRWRHEENAPRPARQQPRERRQQHPVPVAQIGPVHPASQHGDLMPEHEDLNLLGPITARKQDQELKDTAEDEVWDRPGHEQRGCPLHEHARAMDLQLNSADPDFRTRQGFLPAAPAPRAAAWAPVARSTALASRHCCVERFLGSVGASAWVVRSPAL